MRPLPSMVRSLGLFSFLPWYLSARVTTLPSFSVRDMRRPPSPFPSQATSRPWGSQARPFDRPLGSRNTLTLPAASSFIIRLAGPSSNSRKPPLAFQAGPSPNFRSPVTFSGAAPGASRLGSARAVVGSRNRARAKTRMGGQHNSTGQGPERSTRSPDGRRTQSFLGGPILFFFFSCPGARPLLPGLSPSSSSLLLAPR